MVFDDTLVQFADINQQWSGILVGNGASRAVADSFAYTSLYDKACSDDIAHPLVQNEQNLFLALGTRNFEQVLSALSTAKLVNDAFGQSITQIVESYERIRLSLVEAVHAVHVPHDQVPEETLAGIRSALLDYDFVYSTNYDLLVYWAVMQGPDEFRDYFFSGSVFDVGNTEIWHKSTKVLYLHGGLHLYRTLVGQTFKRTAGPYGNLLDNFASQIPGQEGAVPLFITEGSSGDKLRSIYTSDYLSFGYTQLSRHSGPLVIFGHSLENEFDRHLTVAIRGSSSKVLGIGIYPANAGVTVAELKAKWTAKFPSFELFFFNSSTHPLGIPTLHI
jgi:hypothetical protein